MKLMKHFVIKNLFKPCSKSIASPFHSMVGRHLLTLKEFSALDIEHLLWSALDLKYIVKFSNNAEKLNSSLTGKSLAAIFQKRSITTRFSFEVGAHQLGAHTILCNKDDIHLGVDENIKDSLIIMSSLCEAIAARVNEHSLLEEMIKYSKVPVINSLSNTHHPMQALAYLMTIKEHFGYLKGLKIAWVGDGNNVLHSLLIACAKMKMNVSASCPNGYEPCSEILAYVKDIANCNDTEIKISNKPKEVVKDADIIVADTWISMGQENEKIKRLNDFKSYQVDLNLVKHAKKDWIFLHCLPRNQEEVIDEIFYHKQSLVFQQAENRKWTTMSVLVNLIKGYYPSEIKSKPIF